MKYINTLTGQYPITETEIRAEYPNTSFPEVFVAPQPYAIVLQIPLPTFNQITHTCVEGDPVYTTKLHWEQTWVVTAKPSDQLAAEKLATQEAKWEAIKAERDRRVVNGVKVGNDWFHSDTFSRTQQLGLVMMGANMPAGIQWKTMDATFVTMTPALATQIFQATALADTTLFARAEEKHQAMLAMADPSPYDVMAGWPETHA